MLYLASATARRHASRPPRQRDESGRRVQRTNESRRCSTRSSPAGFAPRRPSSTRRTRCSTPVRETTARRVAQTMAQPHDARVKCTTRGQRQEVHEWEEGKKTRVVSSVDQGCTGLTSPSTPHSSRTLMVPVMIGWPLWYEMAFDRSVAPVLAPWSASRCSDRWLKLPC